MTITLTWRRTLTVLALALIIVIAYALGTSRSSGTAYAAGVRPTASSSAMPAADPDHVTVSATGTVAGTPDTIRTSFSVSVTAGTVDGAVNQANAAMARVQKALKAHGVAAKDMQTSNVSLYSYTTHPKGGPVIRHYSMSESLTATVRAIDKASAAISDAISAGGPAVNLDQVSLDLTDDSALVTSARKAAFDSAKGKAEQYAGLAGRSLGAVTSIVETVRDGVVQPMYAMSRTVAAADMSAIPIEKGSQDVGVTVTVVFALT
jgi:uncharacterized protein YggE